MKECPYWINYHEFSKHLSIRQLLIINEGPPGNL